MTRKTKTDQENILQMLVRRELGLERSSSVTRFSKLRVLVTKSPSRRFVELKPSPFHCNGKIRYGEGKIILPNRETGEIDCYDLRHNRNKMIKLWSAPARPRWEDYLVESGPLPPPLSPPLPRAAHLPGILVLREDNRLRRHDLETGHIQTDILLSRTEKFTDMSCDRERNWLILTSTHPRVKTDVVLSFIILQPRTLEFNYHFNIRKSIFGKSVQTANIVGGLLLIMFTNKMIEVFSIDEVLGPENRVPADEISDSSDIHINIVISQRPVCLYKLKTHNHHLEFNMNPWLYIKALSDQEFSVHHMSDICDENIVEHEMLEQGQFGTFSTREKEEHLEFCPEQPTRIIQYGSLGLRLYEKRGKRLEKMFDYDPGKDEDLIGNDDILPAQQRPEAPIRSGRKVRRPENYYEEISEKLYSVIYDFENELEVFAVLVSSETVDEAANALITHVSHLDIYDKHFKQIRRIPLNIVHARTRFDVASQTSVMMDQDLVLVQVKTSVKSFIYIFQSRETSQR